MSNLFVASLGEWRVEHQPLARSFATAVVDAVLDGRVAVGSTLPSERSLARTLGMSRGTVVAALSTLRDQGWVHTRHGGGSVVRLPPHITERTAPWSLDHAGRLDLTLAMTAAPHDAYQAALRRATELCAPLLVDAGAPSAGLPNLRELLAHRYTRDGLPTRPDQILVTSGAQAALTLLADHYHDRRRPVIVENPTFPGALAILRRRQARLLTTPVWDIDQLTDLVRRRRAGLAYLTPDFHNPTGAVMPADARARVADLADVTVIVDETMRDLDLRTPPEPMPHLVGPNVITIGSASKTIWSGLRVGWIRTSAARVRELLLNPLQAQLSPPPLEQLIAQDLLSDPGGVLCERRTRLRTQRDHLATLLAKTDDWSFTLPPGGLTLWLRLRNTTATALTENASRLGLTLSPGPHFSADRTLTRHVRLPFTATTDILDQAVTLLRQALP
jgi:DNA-binding transcriptional MocR family regulator